MIAASVAQLIVPMCQGRDLTPTRKFDGFLVMSKNTQIFKVIKSLDEMPLKDVVSCFSRINPKFSNGKDEEDKVREAKGKLYRGTTLLKHSLNWDNPAVGGGGKSDSIRGFQWRLVMAYSGYEQIEQALFAGHTHIRDTFLEGLKLKNKLPGPVLSQSAMDHIDARESAVDELCDFLGIRSKKRKDYSDWLLGKSVEVKCENSRTLSIIAQLRHLVAHGALSADRANKLGLVLSFSVAPAILHEVAGAILKTLISKTEKQIP